VNNDDDLGDIRATGAGCVSIFFGLALLGIAGIYYSYFSLFEESGNPQAPAPWCVALPYNFLGKWITLALIGIPGIWFLYVALRAFVRNDGNHE
jgi:hypothetical protein